MRHMDPADKQKSNVNNMVKVASMVIWIFDQRHDRSWTTTSNTSTNARVE